MKDLRHPIGCPLAVLGLLGTAFGAHATTVVVDQPGGASTVVIDQPADATENRFPFGGPFESNPGTVYQQAYSAAQFPSAGTIHSFAFTRGSTTGDLWAGTYTFTLSTASSGVNNLHTSDFDSNLGADAMHFVVLDLSGAAPPLLRIDGGAFFYDPAHGDLLLDIRIVPEAAPPFSGAFYRAVNNHFGTTASRAHDFGLGFQSSGLVTEFEFTPVPEPSPLLLAGLGLVATLLRRRRGHV